MDMNGIRSIKRFFFCYMPEPVFVFCHSILFTVWAADLSSIPRVTVFTLLHITQFKISDKVNEYESIIFFSAITQ